MELPDNVVSDQVVCICYTSAACVLFSPQAVVEGGQRNTSVVYMIGKNPLQTEEMLLEFPHGNLFTFSL